MGPPNNYQYKMLAFVLQSVCYIVLFPGKKAEYRNWDSCGRVRIRAQVSELSSCLPDTNIRFCTTQFLYQGSLSLKSQFIYHLRGLPSSPNLKKTSHSVIVPCSNSSTWYFLCLYISLLSLSTYWSVNR